MQLTIQVEGVEEDYRYNDQENYYQEVFYHGDKDKGAMINKIAQMCAIIAQMYSITPREEQNWHFMGRNYVFQL